jgi:N-methylhydantoinase B/oxoprolinase/acetone carboxylase alpha subunit
MSNTPVEALELAYPRRLERYTLRPGSGGEGTHRGGDGAVPELRVLEGRDLAEGDILTVETPGGGGYGRPEPGS